MLANSFVGLVLCYFVVLLFAVLLFAVLLLAVCLVSCFGFCCGLVCCVLRGVGIILGNIVFGLGCFLVFRLLVCGFRLFLDFALFGVISVFWWNFYCFG